MDTAGKSALRMSKIAKFESDKLKTNEDIAPQSRKTLLTFTWHKFVPPTIQISIKFHDFVKLYLRSLHMSLSNLARLLIKVLFPVPCKQRPFDLPR